MSQACHALARPYIYYTLKITTRDSEGLGDLVANIAQTLQHNAGFRYVKRLVVDGELIPRETAEFSRQKSTKRIEVFAADLHGSLDHYESVLDRSFA